MFSKLAVGTLILLAVGETTGFGKGIYDYLVEKYAPESQLYQYLKLRGPYLPLYWPKISTYINQTEPRGEIPPQYPYGLNLHRVRANEEKFLSDLQAGVAFPNQKHK